MQDKRIWEVKEGQRVKVLQHEHHDTGRYSGQFGTSMETTQVPFVRLDSGKVACFTCFDLVGVEWSPTLELEVEKAEISRQLREALNEYANVENVQHIVFRNSEIDKEIEEIKGGIFVSGASKDILPLIIMFIVAAVMFMYWVLGTHTFRKTASYHPLIDTVRDVAIDTTQVKPLSDTVARINYEDIVEAERDSIIHKAMSDMLRSKQHGETYKP